VGTQRNRHRGVDSRQLLHDQRVSERVAARASVLLRKRDAHQVELAEPADDVVGKGVCAIELLGHRRDLLFREVANGAL